MRGDKYNHYPTIFSLNPHTFHVQAEVRLRRKGVAGRGLVSGSRQDAEAAGNRRPKGGWRRSRNLDAQPHPLPYLCKKRMTPKSHDFRAILYCRQSAGL